MKIFKTLRALRIAVALAVFCLISAQFADVYHSLGNAYYSADPTSLMYAPALLKILAGCGLAAGWAFVAFTLAAFAFGRAYCSFACPFGILMDILRRLSLFPAKSRFLKNTAAGKFCKKSFSALKYSPAIPFARWVFLALSAAAIAFGYGALFGFVEPYSLYGKIMGSIAHPAASLAVDEAGRLLSNRGVYSVPPVGGDPSVPLASFAIGRGDSLRDMGRERLARENLLQLHMPRGRAARAILQDVAVQARGGQVLMRLLRAVREKLQGPVHRRQGQVARLLAMRSVFRLRRELPQKVHILQILARREIRTKSGADELGRNPPRAPAGRSGASRGNARRSFGAALLSLGAIARSAAKSDARAGANSAKDDASPYSLDPADPRSRMPSPPGSKSVENFLEKCTGCQICTAACKAHILKPSLGQWGLSGLMRPYMDYSAGFCLHACQNCSNACPTGAIQFISEDDKRYEKIGTAIFEQNLCVVKTDGTDCAACAEHCPVQAIEMVPFGDPKNSLYIPHVHGDVCIGCGACEYICPVLPRKAIVVRGLAVHRSAARFDESMRIYKPEIKEPKPSAEKPAADNPFPF